MISAAQEQAPELQDGARDSVQLEFADGERGVHGFMQVTRVGGGPSELLAVLFAGGEPVVNDVSGGLAPIGDWDRARAGSAALATAAPLERWSASYDSQAGGFELELSAASPLVDFDEPPGAPLAQAAARHGYEQLCLVQGSARAGKQRIEVDGIGRRVHGWSGGATADVTTTRSVFAFAGGSGMSVAAVRPAGATDHGHELIAGHLLGLQVEPLPLEEVRLSTVYDQSGRPREAGLELRAPGDEMPRRVAGEATFGVSIESDTAIGWVAFFQWTFDGAPGIGSYQLVRRR